MTILTRPNPGDPLSSSNGKASTVILDEAFDVIEVNEAAITARTSSNVITTEPYSDIAELSVNTAEATTGWHAVNTWSSDPTPGPATSSTRSTGTFSIQASLNAPNGVLTPKLYVNLTEAGFASGINVTPGQLILVDILCSEFNAFSPSYGLFQTFSVTIASGVDMTGTTVFNQLSSQQVQSLDIGTWYTIAVPVGALTNIRSIGITKTLTNGSGSSRARWHLDNIRRASHTPIDQAMNSQTTVSVVVPPDYTSAVTQYPLALTTKSITDLRPDRIHGGTKWLQDYQIDLTGTVDVTHQFQDILDTLVDGDTLVLPPKSVFNIEGTLEFLTAGITIEGNGARFFQLTRQTEKIFLVNAARVKLRNFQIFGYRNATGDGSTMTTVTGSPTGSGTAVLLDALNEEVRIPLTSLRSRSFARDYLYRNRFDFVLSDSAGVASDCVIQVKDGTTDVVLSTTAFTLNSTPTVKTVYYTPTSLTQRLNVTVKKATATANVITVGSYTQYGHTAYSSSFEFNHGIEINDSADFAVIENILIEGVNGDGISIAGNVPTLAAQNVTVRNVTVRSNGRQSYAPCGGKGHLFENCSAIFSGRWGVDMEPETALHGILSVRWVNLWIFCCTNGGIAASAWHRVHRIDLEGCLYENDGNEMFIAGGVDNGHWADIHIRRLDTTVDTYFGFQVSGRNLTIDGVTTDNGIQVITGSGTTEEGVAVTSGAITLRNVNFTRTIPIGYIKVDSAGVHLENITVHSGGATFDTTANAGAINIMPDTTYTNIDVVPLRTSLPASYRGVAMGQAWFPTGLDLRNEPVSQVRALSGTSTKGNNLGRFAVPMTAGNTTLTVPFPAKTYQNFTSATLSSWTGGTLTPATTYFYRIGARPRQGGPMIPLVQQSVATAAGTGNAVRMVLAPMYNTANGIYIEGITVYRGTVSGTYTMRYDVVPTGDLPQFGSFGSPPRFAVVDLGTTMDWSSTEPSAWFYGGYSFPYTGTPGAFTPVDETGWEVDANYAVFVETSWQTTWRASAKRRDGFDLEFGVAAPTGNHTVSYMIARL